MKKINFESIKSNNIFKKTKFFFEKAINFLTNVWQKLLVFFRNEKFRQFFTSKIFLRIALVLVLLFAIAQVVFGVLIYGFKNDSKATRIAAVIIPFPAAVVNQDVISYSQYLHERDYIHHFYSSTEQQSIDYAEVDKQVLDQLIDNKLIAFQAFKYNSRVKKGDVDSAINQIIDENGGREQVEKVLNDLYGLTLQEFKELVRTQMVRDQLDKDVIGRVTASHILIRVDQNAPAEQIDAAKAKIDGIKTEIANGLDFAEAAKKYSEDTGSAEQGGALEPFTIGEMVPEFSEAAFATPVGQISDPIKSEFGWHIIKVEKKTGKIDKSFGDWLEDLRKRSLILKLVK